MELLILLLILVAVAIAAVALRDKPVNDFSWLDLAEEVDLDEEVTPKKKPVKKTAKKAVKKTAKKPVKKAAKKKR